MTIFSRPRLNYSERMELGKVNRKIDALVLKERERGHLTSIEKTRFRNLARYHKKLVFAR